MRLLNTKTLQFAEFYDSDIPHYAILSHRWGSDEVSYSDFVACQNKDTAGYVKIIEACELAADYYDYDWIWIDTCCINKDSSTEVSEAINTMYRWYRNAELCLAYLSDVSSKPEGSTYEAFLLEFQNSEWFTRGWTLQELLAPPEVIFVSNQWQPIGTRNGYATVISKITNIDYDAILHQSSPEKWSIASRMSWASRRRTSRVEDEAYCLLGLFGINMPLLYGEGRRAFRRLQEEIVRTEDDESVFAWYANPDLPKVLLSENIFAPSTSNFAHCGNISKALYDERQPYSMTNRGLRIDVVLLRWNYAYIIPLNCCKTNAEGSVAPLALEVHEIEQRGNFFERRECIEMGTALYEAFARSKLAHVRTVVYMLTNAPEIKMFTQWAELGKKIARCDEKKTEAVEILEKVDSGLMSWAELDPGKLHILCTIEWGYERAENACMQALQACEKFWGVEHASTLSMVYKIGHFYAYKGNSVKATEMYMRALLGYERAEGGDHPSTRTITRKIQSLHGPKREKTLEELYWWK